MFLELTGEDALTAAEVRLVRVGQRSVAAPTRPEEANSNSGHTNLLGCLCASKALRRFAGIELGL